VIGSKKTHYFADVHPGNMLLAPGDYEITQQIIGDLCRADSPPEVQPEGYSLVDRPLQWPVPQSVDELCVKLVDMSSGSCTSTFFKSTLFLPYGSCVAGSGTGR